MAAASTVTTLQANLDAMVRSGSPVDCSKSYGGGQEIKSTTGEITWKKGLRISSNQHVYGSLARMPRITYLGGPQDPPAFEIWSYSDNGYVDMPTISNLQIHCPNGAKAIDVHSSVKTLKGFTCERVVTTGGIRFDCETYAALLDFVRIYTKGQQALYLGGGVNETNYLGTNCLHRVEVHGYAQGVKANIEIHGACNLEGFCWFEDLHEQNTPADAAPMLYFGDQKEPNGASHRGNVAVAGLWHDEAHKHRLWAVVDGADFTATNIGGTELWPWHVQGGGVIRTQMPVHNAQTVRSPDGTGKLYVGGQPVALEPVS